MFMPISNTREIFRSRKAEKARNTIEYRDRISLPLAPDALRHFSCIFTANGVETVESALERLVFYDCESHKVTSWKH